MFEQWIGIVLRWLVNQGVIDESEKNLYGFAVECFLNLIGPLFLAIIIGMCFDNVLRSIILVLPFMILRKYSGGYHAKTRMRCFFFSVSILIFFNYMVMKSNINLITHILLCISIICISLVSPVDSQNRKLNNMEKKRYRNMCQLLLILFLLIYFLLNFKAYYNCAISFAFGIILTACLQLPVLIFKNHTLYGQ